MEEGHTIGIEQDNTNHWKVHYDFEVLSPCKTKSILFEVKNDKRCKDTGNFFIEFAHGDGEPSGIRITTAHFHIFTNCDNYWMMPTSRILQVIQQIPLRKVSAKETILNDRGEKYQKISSWGYLVPCKMPLEHAIEL